MHITVEIPDEVVKDYLLSLGELNKSDEEIREIVQRQVGQVLAEHFVSDQEIVFYDIKTQPVVVLGK